MATATIILMVLAALLNAGSGIASYVSQKKTNEQNQQNYEDWKEYNTPANQMQRLEDAGLNPYLVSNVGNTLSQPFQIGTNSGISEMLNGLSQSVASAGSFAQNHYEQSLNRDIQQQNLEVRKSQLDLNQLALNIREKLARNAWRIGDARSALLYSQARGQDILNLYNRSAMPYRLTGLYYGNQLKQQQLEHNAVMYPLLESYYEPVQRAKINQIYSSISHYNFMEEFMKEKFMKEMELKWDNYWHNVDMDWHKFYQADKWFNLRYGLSRDYFGLAQKKFRWGNFWQGLNTVNSLAKTFGDYVGLGMKYPGMKMRFPKF